MSETLQEGIWKQGFGKAYTDRNTFDNDTLDRLYVEDIGISRTQMNEDFIGSLDRNIRILEVGSNIGLQLINLQKMGFTNLYGIELQPDAVEKSKDKTKGINIIQGTAYDLPFKDGYFDLVFTSRVLIHLNPNNIDTAINEIIRCSNKYVYGNEYFNEELVEILNYHGETEICWKRDFPKLFSDKGLTLIKEQKYKYTFNDDVDTTYLLEKL